MKKVKSIHFVGIKGVGMAPLAIIAKEAGIRVTGCDIDEEFITDAPLKKAGITSLVGFSHDHVRGIDLVITTGAHGGFDNEEVVHARKVGIPIMTQGEAVGVFMDGKMLGRSFEGISVTGTHGKTTTTAMVATLFKGVGLDPTFVVGTGSVPSLGTPGHYGKGKYFIAEADEYVSEPKYDKTVKFLWQHPSIVIITSIEFDHPDVYGSIDQMRMAFLDFTKNITSDGVLIACGDDHEVRTLLRSFKGRVITYGQSVANDFVVTRVHSLLDQSFFRVETRGTQLGEFIIGVPGDFNAVNATAAIVAGLESGISVLAIRDALATFRGTKRRFEYVGKLPSGAAVFDDYAHHPTEVIKTLKAFRQVFPKKKIVCIFQPHTYSRTKILFDQFLRSFSDADTAIITDIYPSLREQPDPTVSSKLLSIGIARHHRHVLFLPRLQNVVEYIDQNRFGEDTVVITMGAGDVYKISAKLKAQSAKL